MKIALIGYGKMGKTIEEIAVSQGHTIVAKLDTKPTKENINGADVAIEFSTPSSAYENVISCMELNLPVVCGTTAWLDKLVDAEEICNQKNGAFIYASNFSLGVNLFFEINKRVAEIMNLHSEYDVRMEEIHHTEKKDAPSGTAITLAEEIIPVYKFDGWKLSEKSENNKLGIEAKRIPEVPGTHSVIYTSEVDKIEMTHVANTRKGFASGAILAAQWLIGKHGVFTMKDVLGFK